MGAVSLCTAEGNPSSSCTLRAPGQGLAVYPGEGESITAFIYFPLSAQLNQLGVSELLGKAPPCVPFCQAVLQDPWLQLQSPHWMVCVEMRGYILGLKEKNCALDS